MQSNSGALLKRVHMESYGPTVFYMM